MSARVAFGSCVIAGLAITSALACNSKTETSGACAPKDVIVVASDYTSSAIGGFSSSGSVDLAFGADLGKDPQLATSSGRAFCLARDLDEIFEMDTTCADPIARYSVHDDARQGSMNPQDVAVGADGSIWVPEYNVPELTVLDANGNVTKRIDLSSFDADGNPQASAIDIVSVNGAEKAFVTLERLDDAHQLASNETSLVLRVDVATRALDGTMTLAGKNPFNVAYTFGGFLWLAEPGNFDDATETLAGIEKFDPVLFQSILIVQESALGGSVAEAAIRAGCGVAIVANAVTNVNATALVSFDPDTGNVHASASAPILATDGYDLQGLSWENDVLFVGDRRRAADGYPVHAFDFVAPCTLTPRADTVFMSQKPVAMRAARGGT